MQGIVFSAPQNKTLPYPLTHSLACCFPVRLKWKYLQHTLLFTTKNFRNRMSVHNEEAFINEANSKNNCVAGVQPNTEITFGRLRGKSAHQVLSSFPRKDNPL